MANTAQSKKRTRQNAKAATRNKAQRSQMRTAVKKAIKKIDASDKNATSSLKTACSILDKMASKKRIHKNKAARLKSRLNARAKKTPGK